jgi:transcriptional regulator with XRE-family HTH domain
MMRQEDLYQAVGQRIRRVREERRFTQAELAELVSLSRTSITNIEQGRQKLLLHTLYDIAAALTVKPSELLPSGRSSVEAEAFEQRLPSDLSNAEQEWIRTIVTGSKKGD